MYSYHAAHHILTPTAQRDTAFQTAMSQWMIIQSPCSRHPLHQIPTPQLQREEKTLESDNNLVEKKMIKANKQPTTKSECSIPIPSIHLLHCTLHYILTYLSYPIRHRPLRLFPDSAQNRILQDPPITASRTTPTDLDAAS